MRSVVIIGYGNVGQALAAALQDASAFTVKQVLSRTPSEKEALLTCPVVRELKDLAEADLYLLCVNDDAIAAVSREFPFQDRLIAHTSGSMPMDTLEPHDRRGVCYPLQSFSQGKPINWKEVPFCLEATTPEDLDTLKLLAQELSERVYGIDSAQRRKIHLAAVVVNNFTNHLYHLASDLCKQHGIPFEVLHPLILETAQKIREMDPYDAQTGPARRNDQKTLNSQRLQVKNTPLESVYNVLTASILATYEREKL